MNRMLNLRVRLTPIEEKLRKAPLERMVRTLSILNFRRFGHVQQTIRMCVHSYLDETHS